MKSTSGPRGLAVIAVLTCRCAATLGHHRHLLETLPFYNQRILYFHILFSWGPIFILSVCTLYIGRGERGGRGEGLMVKSTRKSHPIPKFLTDLKLWDLFLIVIILSRFLCSEYDGSGRCYECGSAYLFSLAQSKCDYVCNVQAESFCNNQKNQSSPVLFYVI